jgi:hypothetical protein
MGEPDEITTIHWTPLLEKYFASTGEKAHCYAYLHKRAEELYSNRSVFIDLPCIVLATLNGATSIGSTSLFGDDKYASVGIGIVALFTAILQTIGTYFGWARRAEAHKIASLNYAKLYRFLRIEMALPRESRMKPKDLLKNIKEQYDRLAEVSPLIPSKTIKEFKEKFNTPEYAEISKPEESNGLEEIIIYTSNKDSERTAISLSPSAPLPPPMSLSPPPRLPELSVEENEMLREAVAESRGE